MTWDWAFTFEVVVPRLAQGAQITLLAAILAFVVAASTGLILMLLGASRNKVVSTLTREVIAILRGTPLLVQIFFLFFILPEVGIVLPPFATGVMAIGLYNAAQCAEVYRGAFRAVPTGQWEAGAALGLSKAKTFRLIIFPQLLRPITPALGNYLLIIFKETPLLSFVAVNEMMNQAKLIGSEYYRFTEAMTMTGVFFLALSLVASFLIHRLEHRLKLH